jgi:hypothetical protein
LLCAVVLLDDWIVLCAELQRLFLVWRVFRLLCSASVLLRSWNSWGRAEDGDEEKEVFNVRFVEEGWRSCGS